MNKTENEIMHKAVERCIEKGKGNGSLYSLYQKGFSRGYKQDGCNNANCPKNIRNAPENETVKVSVFDNCEERI